MDDEVFDAQVKLNERIKSATTIPEVRMLIQSTTGIRRRGAPTGPPPGPSAVESPSERPSQELPEGRLIFQGGLREARIAVHGRTFRGLVNPPP